MLKEHSFFFFGLSIGMDSDFGVTMQIDRVVHEADARARILFLKLSKFRFSLF